MLPPSRTREPLALLLPGTPLLLAGIDRGEPAEMTALRASVTAELRTSAEWSAVLPAPIPARPTLLSLGGLGIRRGVLLQDWQPDENGAPVCRTQPAALLSGAEFDAAAEELRRSDPESAAAADAVHTGHVVAVVAALEAGAAVRIRAGHSGRPPEETRPQLVPLDFSGAAHPDAPLAPRDGAREFDAALQAALLGPLDLTAVLAAAERAAHAAAWTGALLQWAGTPPAAAAAQQLHGVMAAETDVHHVRYRSVRVERAVT